MLLHKERPKAFPKKQRGGKGTAIMSDSNGNFPFEVIFFVTSSPWLWYMLTRSTQWARFTEKDHDFWIRRGLPVKWAGACKEFEQGTGMKVLVAFCILAALVLTITPFVLAFISSHHR